MSMLHRSFKPAKCKTALKLSVSRIKLLNNKRENQVKQMKRELAQLLESGQIPTARIRVEHVIREEKTLTAYNFIEVYCELIAARLPIIESQKNCPIDLKEAITSVIFAAPRCADVPELADIRKQFTAKYGKEFVSTALDLRPECGVNRVLVEKLSAVAPDGPTKLKVLNAIAEEHNVKWNPDSFGGHDSKSSQDLLNGPNNLEMMSKVHAEVSPGPVWTQADKGPPNVQVPHTYNQRHDASVNFNEQNVRPTSGYQKNYSTDVSPGKATTSDTFHTDLRSSGHAMDRMEHNQSVSGNENAHSSGRQNWNVQFKDATSAAQAAAESAELASMAARAAAELSRQYSSESHKLSHGYVQKDEKPQIYAEPKLSSHHIAKQADDAFHGKNSRHRDKHIIDNEQEQLAGEAERFRRDSFRNSERYNNAASLKSSSASADDATVLNSLRTGDRYSQRKSTESDKSDILDEVSKRKDKNQSEFESSSEETASFDKNVTRKYAEVVPSHSYSSSSGDDKEDVLKKNENVAFFEDVVTEKQSSRASSGSHSSTLGDIHEDIFKRNDPSENPSVHNDRSMYRNTSEINSSDNTLMFDDYGSDEDNNKVDVGDYNGQETSSYFSSLSRKPSANLFAADSSVWSLRNADEELRKSTSQSHPPEFSESLKGSSVASQQDVSPPAAFDDYDSQGSECEEHFGKSKLHGGADFDHFSSEINLNSKSSEPLQSEDHILQSSTSETEGSRRNSWLPTTSVDQFPKKVHPDRSQGHESSSVSEKKFNYAELSPRLMKSGLDLTAKDTLESSDTMEDFEDTKESSSASSTQELSFGTLKGGLRNKSNKRPPYMRKSSENSLSVEQESKGSFSRIEQSSYSSTIRTSIGSGAADKQDPHSEDEDTNLNNNVDMRTLNKPTESVDNHLEEESQQKTSTSRQSYTQNLGIELNKKLNVRGSHNYFDSDDSDSEEDLPKLTPTRNAYPGFGISRRTKASPDSGRTYSRTNVLSEESTAVKYSAEVKTTTPKYRAETKTNVISDDSITPKYRPETKTDVFTRESRTPEYSAESKSSSSSFYAGDVLPKPSPKTKIADYSVEQYTSKPILESRRSSRTESPKSTPRKQAFNSLHASVEEDSPKPIPDSKRSSRLSSTSEQTLNLQHDTPKPIPASVFSHMESSKPSRRERPSKSLPKNSKSGVTESSKPSVTRETSSNDKTGHVHPKLPDSDAFTAFFHSLKQTRE